MKTVAYIRVSTSHQLEGSGPDQQRTNIIAYAVASGISIDEWILEDETGTTYDREKIQSALLRCQKKEIGKIVLDRPDRLGRTLAVSERLYEDFKAAGTDVVYTSVHYDSSPSGNLFRQIMSALAEFDRSSWLQRMAQCRKATVARKGTFAGGRAPYGVISIGNAQLCIDPNSVDIVRSAFGLAEQGQTVAAITRHLNAQGFRTRKGTQFYPQQVKRILERRDFYEGRRTLSKSVKLEDGIKPAQPALIT